MKVAILAGGKGTRLAEETEIKPKPMVLIGGRPMLWHIMRKYSQHGFKRFVLCLGYRGNMIKEHFLNYEAMNNDFTVCLGPRREIHYHSNHHEDGFVVTLADTGLDSMTGKRLKAVERYVSGDTFMMTYGDGVSDVDLRSVLDFHRTHGKLATVTTVRPESRYGVLDIDPSGTVQLDGQLASFAGPIDLIEQMGNAFVRGCGAATHHADHAVSFGQEKLSQIGAVLARYARY